MEMASSSSEVGRRESSVYGALSCALVEAFARASQTREEVYQEVVGLPAGSKSPSELLIGLGSFGHDQVNYKARLLT